MSHPTKDTYRFYTDQLKELIGKKIDGIVLDKDDDHFVFVGLVIDGKFLWLLSDDEANAPGSFAIEPAV